MFALKAGMRPMASPAVGSRLSRRADVRMQERGLRVLCAASTSAPSAGETAKTVVSLVGHGTIALNDSSNVPICHYAQYVLDETGQPLLLLNLEVPSGTKTSLLVQPPTNPARSVARVTLVGALESAEASDKILARLAERREPFGSSSSSSLSLYRLVVDTCHVNLGFGTTTDAQVVPGSEFANAEPDSLVGCAATLSVQWNEAREEDLVRIASHAVGVSFDEITTAELLWVDQYGAYVRVLVGGEVKNIRVPFSRPVRDERDARSLLTMMAQAAWETDKQYFPVVAMAEAQAADTN